MGSGASIYLYFSPQLMEFSTLILQRAWEAYYPVCTIEACVHFCSGHLQFPRTASRVGKVSVTGQDIKGKVICLETKL